uniref:Uncharacterized protein n=1 Tax=Anguilla anguilla TaxID=7936 RepID=A0A0E9VYD2_ANGAN
MVRHSQTNLVAREQFPPIFRWCFFCPP